MKADAILVLDFGGQYCHLIARRIRENSVYSEIVAHDVSPAEIRSQRRKINVKGLVLSGGPQSVFQLDAPRINPTILELNLPVLGLCYGHQLLAYLAGGKVEPADKKEFGMAVATVDKAVGVLKGLKSREKVWMSHSDTVYDLGEKYEPLAHTENCPVAAFRHKEKPVYGLQWHPEVIHTESGSKVFANFLFKVCHCRPNWKMEDFIEKSVKETRRMAGDDKVLVALSGGVDSSTATAIAAKAIGKKLTAIFVDHGFMREGEPETVRNMFSKYDINFVTVDARHRFMHKLSGITNPEQKRKIVGEEFIRVFEEEASKVGAKHLLQGTIYPDKIESGFKKKSEMIKTHHNVGGLPTRMKFQSVIEPLKDLYKDEVHKVAQKLRLPEEIVGRQPFPGPGLAVRIIGEITESKLNIVRRADKIVSEEIEKAAIKSELWQYFAVLTNAKSTGVKGDSRAYGYVAAVRIVESRDAMTAGYAKIPHEILERISARITNEIDEITRVVYDITHKPPATIEWE